MAWRQAVVAVRAMKPYGNQRYGSIHTYHRDWMEESGQPHAPAAVFMAKRVGSESEMAWEL